MAAQFDLRGKVAIVTGASKRGLASADAQEFAAVPGYGVQAVVDARRLALGNLKFMQREGVLLGELEQEARRLADDGKTPMFVAVDGLAAGIVAVADTVKADSQEAIAALQRMGLEVVMITGDNRLTAAAIAANCERGGAWQAARAVPLPVDRPVCDRGGGHSPMFLGAGLGPQRHG